MLVVGKTVISWVVDLFNYESLVFGIFGVFYR